jgi:hypothetical protein
VPEFFSFYAGICLLVRVLAELDELHVRVARLEKHERDRYAYRQKRDAAQGPKRPVGRPPGSKNKPAPLLLHVSSSS